MSSFVPPWVANPPVPGGPKRFRRTMRVRLTNARPSQCHAQIGTITNNEAYVYNNGKRYVRVRWDHQHPYETGCTCDEAELVPETAGENEFELRRYDLRYLSHEEIAMLRRVIGHSADQEAVAFFRKLPELPK